MDETPYPAPAAAYEPIDAPPPQYSPEAPYSAQPPKNWVVLIIGIVIIMLLLCCCGSGVGGYLFFSAAGEDATATLEESIGEAIGEALTGPTDLDGRP